jgi:hypothetical protein
MKTVKRHWKVFGLVVIACLAVGVFVGSTASGASKNTAISFDMVRSAAATNGNCLAHAGAHVDVHSTGPVEVMRVR